ncbi:glycoside hydrolase family 5 protein [Flavobacterium columnare]|uniref:glycoside hydrolase family 5 protein n=1 Tax=Flavobacterium columnare TaxID=996 RepID=UPI0013D4746C|nr:cellulase family glycosylhydrolase [Flavobacterium columnare]
MNRLITILLLISISVTVSCQNLKKANVKKRSKKTEKVIGTYDSPISPKNYQSILGKGIDVTWAESKKGIANFNSKMVKDFKQSGLEHIRIRVKDYPDNILLSHLTKVVNECLANDLIPIIAYHGGAFEEIPTMENLDKSVDWWRKVSDHFKNYTHKVSFDLIIEVTDALNKENEMLNLFYEKATTEIRKYNPTRIVMISPRVRSAPEYLKDLKIPTQHNNYLMAEWHFYASGPDKENPLKKWTSGTDEEKELIRAKIKTALTWQNQTGIYTWVGAWMAGNYNKGDDYTVNEQVVFASFVVCELTKNKIPFAFNADQKYYDSQKNEWIENVKPVYDEIIKTNCK